MSDFFNEYFNIKKIIQEKREYKQQMARVDGLPKDYQFVFKKIQNYCWMFAAGSGFDMMQIHYDLIELFEQGAADGQSVLEITGEDVATFCEELLKNAQTYTENWKDRLNREIREELKGKGNDKK